MKKRQPQKKEKEFTILLDLMMDARFIHVHHPLEEKIYLTGLKDMIFDIEENERVQHFLLTGRCHISIFQHHLIPLVEDYFPQVGNGFALIFQKLAQEMCGEGLPDANTKQQQQLPPGGYALYKQVREYLNGEDVRHTLYLKQLHTLLFFEMFRQSESIKYLFFCIPKNLQNMTPTVLQLYRKRSTHFSLERELLQEFIIRQATLVAKNRKTHQLGTEPRDYINHFPRYSECVPESITEVGEVLEKTLTKWRDRYHSMFETSVVLENNIDSYVDTVSQKNTTNRSDIFNWMKQTLDSSNGSCVPDSDTHPLITYFLHDMYTNYDVQIRGRCTFKFEFKNYQRLRRVSKGVQSLTRISTLKKQMEGLQQESHILREEAHTLREEAHTLREEVDLLKKRSAPSHKQDKDRAKRNKPT